MAQKLWRDWVYLAIISTQLFGMLALDLVAFYPKSLYLSPSAPLHFLVTLRKTYVAHSADPFFAGYRAAWFHGLLLLEGLVQLPLAVYLVSRLASRRPSSGATELAGLAFGCLTAMGSWASCFELYSMGPELVADENKTKLLYGTYLPFFIIPAIMAVDMYSRLLSRIQSASHKSKHQ